MHSYIHGTLWLTCVLLSGDLCAQDAPSVQGVSLPIAVQDHRSGPDDLLSSTNQGNNASRNGQGLFRDATTVERASLLSVIDLDLGHCHQAVFRVRSVPALVLRFQLPEGAREIAVSAYGMKLPLEKSGSEVSVALSAHSQTKVQINYTSESMQAPSILNEGLTVEASTRQIYGSEEVGIDSAPASFVASLMRPWSSTGSVMLRMDEVLNWEIVSQREPVSEELRKVVMPRDAVVSVVDKHALSTRWGVVPAEAVRKLRERLTVTGKADGLMVRFELKRGRHLVHEVAKAYQNHRISLAASVRDKALDLVRRELKAQEARTEAARQRMLKLAARYEIDEMAAKLEADQRSNVRTKASSDQEPTKLAVPQNFVPLFTQAQSGAWPAFHYQIEDLSAKTYRAWLIMGMSVLVIAVATRLFRRRFLPRFSRC